MQRCFAVIRSVLHVVRHGGIQGIHYLFLLRFVPVKRNVLNVALITYVNQGNLSKRNIISGPDKIPRTDQLFAADFPGFCRIGADASAALLIFVLQELPVGVVQIVPSIGRRWMMMQGTDPASPK